MTLDAIVSLPVSLALSILVARKIGPDVLGLYNFANWVLGAGVVVFTNGVAYGMQVFAAEKLGQNDFAGATSVPGLACGGSSVSLRCSSHSRSR